MATAIPADNPDTWLEIAQIQTRHHKRLLLLLEEDMEAAIADEEAFKDAGASMSQPTELQHATSVGGQTTMHVTVRLRP